MQVLERQRGIDEMRHAESADGEVRCLPRKREGFGVARSQAIRASGTARARSLAASSIAGEMSTPVTLPVGATRTQAASVVARVPQPISSTRSPGSSAANSSMRRPSGARPRSIRS